MIEERKDQLQNFMLNLLFALQHLLRLVKGSSSALAVQAIEFLREHKVL